jgi:hypothetical protein
MSPSHGLSLHAILASKIFLLLNAGVFVAGVRALVQQPADWEGITDNWWLRLTTRTR